MPTSKRQYVLDELGAEYVEALERALGQYNDIDFWPSILNPEHARALALACREAETGAIHDLKQLRDWIEQTIEEITAPGHQDERVPYGSPWWGTADEVVVSLARLAEARNRARPAR